jgi:hypothetical protein
MILRAAVSDVRAHLARGVSGCLVSSIACQRTRGYSSGYEQLDAVVDANSPYIPFFYENGFGIGEHKEVWLTNLEGRQ